MACAMGSFSPSHPKASPERAESDLLSPNQDKGIGQEQALYYTAYATFLEMRGAHTRAREAYADGLARCAIFAGCQCASVRPYHWRCLVVLSLASRCD
jgi:hypothetical protein